MLHFEVLLVLLLLGVQLLNGQVSGGLMSVLARCRRLLDYMIGVVDRQALDVIVDDARVAQASHVDHHGRIRRIEIHTERV